MRTLLLSLLLIATGCSAPRGLDEKPMNLTAAERGRIEAKVDAARDPRIGDWTGAWNQAVDAGLGQNVFEGIALDALEDDAGVATEMLEALIKKHGGLTPEARARVDRLSDEAAARGDWARALEIQLAAAEDPPTFSAAWELYAKAPPDEGAALLATLREAREKAEGR